MKLYLVLGVAAALVSTVLGACDACIDGRCLKKQPLPKDSGSFGDINRRTSEYYVTTRSNDHEFITQCRLNTLICNHTANIWNLTDLTVDQSTGGLYASGFRRQGLYKVDLLKNDLVLLDDKEISYMTYKDKLYYAPKQGGIYIYDGGIPQVVPGSAGYVVSHIIVDKNDVIYFKTRINGRARVFKLKNGTVAQFSDVTNRLVTDKDGNVMAISLVSYDVYRLTNDGLVEVGAVTDWVNGPSFDGDNNLIYNIDSHERYYLKEAADVQCAVVKSGLGRTFKQTIVETVRINTGTNNLSNH